MRTLSRLGFIGLLVCGMFLATGAAAGTSAPVPDTATIAVPPQVEPGQQIDVALACPPGDDRGTVRLRGGGISIGTTLSLTSGRRTLSTQVPMVTRSGDYHVDLTCEPSGTTASATARVVW